MFSRGVIIGAVMAAAAGLWAVSAGAAPVTVNDFADPFVPDVWSKTDMRAGGTASIESLAGKGGNLEGAQPLPIGAAKLTTGFDNADKAEVGIFPTDGFGTAGDLLPTLQLGYSYYKALVAGGNASAAPSLKLTFFNGAFDGDGFITLVFEPTWNQPGSVGSSVAVPTDVWTGVSIDFTTGVFWQTGGFGQSNSFGGPPLNTLSDWLGIFDPAFADASLLGISIGVGTFNQGQVGYFDQVSIAADGLAAITYDFEAAAVPEPASLALLGFGLLGLGAARRRRRPHA